MRGSVQYVRLGVVETAGEVRACGGCKRWDGAEMFNAWHVYSVVIYPKSTHNTWRAFSCRLTRCVSCFKRKEIGDEAVLISSVR